MLRPHLTMENIIQLDDDSQPGSTGDSHDSINRDNSRGNNKSSCELIDQPTSNEDASTVHFCWMCISVIDEENTLDKSWEQLLKSFILQFTPSLVYTSNVKICINCYVYLGTSYNIIADFHDKMKILDDYFKIFSKLKDKAQVSYLKYIVDEKILAHKLNLVEKIPECFLPPDLRTNNGDQNSPVFNKMKEKFQATFCKKNGDSDFQNKTEYICENANKLQVESPSTVLSKQDSSLDKISRCENVNGESLDKSTVNTALVDSNLRDDEIKNDLNNSESVPQESNSLENFSFKIDECFTLPEDQFPETSILRKNVCSNKSGEDSECTTSNHILGNNITTKSIDESCVSIDSIAQEFSDVDLVAPNLMSFEGSLFDLEEQLPKNFIERKSKSLISDSQQNCVTQPPAPANVEIKKNKASLNNKKRKTNLGNEIEKQKKGKVSKKNYLTKPSISVDMHITNINSEKVVIVDQELTNSSVRKNQELPSNNMGISYGKYLISNEKAANKKKHEPSKKQIGILKGTSELNELPEVLESSAYVKVPIRNLGECDKVDIVQHLYIMPTSTVKNFQNYAKPLPQTNVAEHVSKEKVELVPILSKVKQFVGRNSSVSSTPSSYTDEVATLQKSDSSVQESAESVIVLDSDDES